ncbi:hypothetical protein ACNOYE_08865 [Nannocystaceae bacterium ST9]
MLDRAAALVVLASLVLLPACGKKPSDEQCKQFSEHFMQLLEESRDKPDARIRQLARTYGEKIEQTCKTEGTAAEVECVLAQSSLADVEANCK